MLKNYRPILIQELNTRLGNFRIRRISLNRHLPDADQLDEHQHRFAQMLLYLSGRGVILAAGRRYDIGPGVVVYVPAGVAHSFQETTGRRPLCLALDWEWSSAKSHSTTAARLSFSDSRQIRQELSTLARLSDPASADNRLLAAAATLRILDLLLRGLGFLAPRQHETPAFVRQYERLLHEAGTPLPAVSTLAAQMGYQPDYLNRIFKQATGQTLREYRDSLLLKKATALLQKHSRVQDVCDALGFDDQNYFTRWFKKNTGMTPGVFCGKSRLKAAQKPQNRSARKPDRLSAAE